MVSSVLAIRNSETNQFQVFADCVLMAEKLDLSQATVLMETLLYGEAYTENKAGEGMSCV